MNLKQLLITILVGTLMGLLIKTAFAVPVTVYCNAPTTRIDGSSLPLNQIGGYNVYYALTPPVKGAVGTTMVGFAISSSLTSQANMTFVVDMPAYNTNYYFAITAFDVSSPPLESGFSGIISKTSPMAPPSPPTAYATPQNVGMN